MNVTVQTLDINGHSVDVTRGGTGPAILFVHGMAGSAETWAPTIERLADDYTVIAPDLPGHGQSDKPRGDYSLGAYASFLRDLLDHLECPSATIVGQSLGGGISMQFTYQYPERCQRLVLVSSGGLGAEVSMILKAMAVPGVELLLPLVVHDQVRRALGGVGTALGKIGLRATPQVAEIGRAYDSLADAETRSAFLHTNRSVVDFRGQRINAHDRLHTATALPTMIVWGDRDRIIPVAHARSAHELIPGSRLEIFEGAGHFPHCEQPDRFAATLADFLDGAAPATIARPITAGGAKPSSG